MNDLLFGPATDGPSCGSKRAVGQPVAFLIEDQLPDSNQITVPEDVDMMVVTFAKVTFPAGSVTISVSD